MSTPTLVLRITVVHPTHACERVFTASPAEKVRDLIRRVLLEIGLTDPTAEWVLSDDGVFWLLDDSDLGKLNYLPGVEIPLVLSQLTDSGESHDWAEEVPSCGPVHSEPLPGMSFELEGESPPVESRALPGHTDCDGSDESANTTGVDAANSDVEDVRRTTHKRATIRYYSRMNPDRVYPLRVLFTRDVVDRVVKRHVEQAATGPLAFDTETPVEIEPVLPGCAVHPPRFATFLDGRDQVITFHVVPHVLGKVSGARVLVRQNHATVAEIELDIRVVQRTWVILSGLSTFAVPAASAAMKHFGLDFKPKDGFNPYLSTANVLFGHVHPVALTAVLAAVTGVLYWLTRPKGRDTFWDVSTSGPAQMLEKVEEAIFNDPDAALAELRELLRAYPDYQPAWVMYAEWHHDHEDYDAACAGYREAMRLGVMEAEQYGYAAHAASRAGRPREALDVLQRAERDLPADRVEPVTFFNMACHHCRLGEHDAAVRCLRRAVAAGYRERKAYDEATDLAPLGGRDDFRALVAGLGR